MTTDPTPKSDSKNVSKFQHEAIEINTEEISPNLFRVVAKVPGEQTSRFFRQLKESGADLANVDLGVLMEHLIAEEAMERLGREGIWDHQIDPEARPASLTPGDEFRIEFELPAFRNPDWSFLSDITVRLANPEPTEAMIDREILDQRLDAGTRTRIDGPVESLDEITIDLVSRVDGEVLANEIDLKFRVPQESERLAIPGVRSDRTWDAVIGMRQDESRTIENTIEEDHPHPGLHHKKVATTITIKRIERIDPASLETVLENYDMRAEPILRMQIRLALEKRLEEERIVQTMRQAFPILTERCAMDIPERVVAMLAANARETKLASAREQGLGDDELAAQMAEHDERTTKTALHGAQDTARFFFLLRHLGIQDRPIGLDETAQAEAAIQGVRPENYRERILHNKQASSLQNRAIKRQVAKALLDVVQIEEI